MLRKMVAGAMGAFLWQLTPAWGHPHHHGGDDHHHHHHHDGDDDGKSLIVNPEGHGFHEVGHWEIDNSFVHLDAKVFEHAKELHDEHMEEWQADHAEEQRAKADSYNALNRETCAATTGEFPMVNMEGRGDDDCKCAACVIKGSKFILGMMVRSIEKKCSMEEIKALSDEHGDSGAVSEWNFDALSKQDGGAKGAHHGHWNPERMRKWFCHAYKGHPEVVLGFVAYMARPMQSAAGWCMGAGYCKKHHDFKSMALEHATSSSDSKKVVDMNEKHHWVHMDVLPQFLKSASQSFMSVGHDGAMEEDHASAMKHFWEQEKAAWGWGSEKEKEEDKKEEDEDKEAAKKQDEEDKRRQEELKEKEKAAAEKEEKKKEEAAKLAQMQEKEAEQVVQARLLKEEDEASHEEGAVSKDVMQRHSHSWLGGMFGKHGHGHRHGPKNGGGMQCPRMKRCMKMAMGWAMKWAVKKTYEMCTKCSSKKVQMMCKWAGAHKAFAFGMLIAHVQPWKFALGRCMHRREGHHHGPNGPHGPHGPHHEGEHHRGGPFAPLLSWLPFSEHVHRGDIEPARRSMEADRDRESKVQTHPLFGGAVIPRMRILFGRLIGDRPGQEVRQDAPRAVENAASSTTNTDADGTKVTRTSQTNENGTTETKTVQGKNFFSKSYVFRSKGA